MVRVFSILSMMVVLSIITVAQEPSNRLKQNCLACHIKQKIPSELVYRRYLLKYSTDKKIEETLFDYLRNPKKENSIMPKQFFMKFPQKDAIDLNETILKVSIKEYLNFFDIKKRLILP